MHYHVASERAQCRKVADELLEFAERIEDESLQAVAATAKGVSFHAEGRFFDSETWLERARSLYVPARDREQGAIFGMDCRVWATAQLAVVEWCMGRTSHAFRLADEAIEWAREVRHVPSLGIGLLYLSKIYQMANDKAGAKRTTDELLAAAATYGLPAFEGYAATIASWIVGDLEGVARIIGVLESLHCYLSLTHHGSFLADIEADAGNIETAIAHVDRYLAMCSERGEHVFEAELARRRAGYELRRAAPDHDVARTWFTRAYLLARDQGMARFEVAAIRDYRRAFAGDDHDALLDRLKEIYDTHPELETEERLL
jgi:tetratricopeptide (TPR) repeat protein